MNRFALAALVLGLAMVGTSASYGQDKKNPRVIMDTSLGKVTIELFEEKAPLSVKNFLQYVDDKHYDGTIFHRVIGDFMVQGGGYEAGMREKKTRAPIKNEGGNGLSNERGTIAMARTGVPDSATSQFYINVVNNKGLDRANSKDGVGYAVFGRVTEGMEVVDQIRRVETKAGDVPRTDVVIRSIRRVSQ